MTGNIGFTGMVDTKAFSAQLCEELRQVLREEHNVMKQSTPAWCRHFQQALAEHTSLLQQLLHHRVGPRPPQEKVVAKERLSPCWNPSSASEWHALVPNVPRRDQDHAGPAMDTDLALGGCCWDLDEIDEEMRTMDLPETPAAPDGFEAPTPRRDPPALDRMLCALPRRTHSKSSPQASKGVSKAWTGNQSPLAVSESEAVENVEGEGKVSSLNSLSSWASCHPRQVLRTPTENSRDSNHEKERDRQEWARHLQNQVSRVLEDKGSLNLGEEWSQPIKVLQTRVSQGFVDIRKLPSKKPFWRMTPTEMIEGLGFQMCVAFLIILNAAFLGYTSNVSMVNTLDPAFPEDPAWFRWVNTAFTVIFALEVMLRASVMRCRFLLGREKLWNLFDALLALSSLVEEVIQDIGMSSLRVVRGLRTVKVLRIIRVMRFFRDLRLMACSIMQSLGSLTWAMILLILIMYLFTVFFMQGAISYLRDERMENLPENEMVRDGIMEYYGNVADTMYTLLASITSGVSWREVVKPIEEIGFMYRLCFCFYVVFVVIGVLNVLTGIFVERACELSGLDKDLVIQSEITRGETFLVEMKKIFEEADADGSGTISWEEFKRYLQNDRVKAYLATQQLDAFDARTLFDILNVNCEDEIGIEKFIVGCQRLRGLAKSVDLVAVLQETRSTNARLKVVLRRLEEQDREMQRLRGRRVSGQHEGNK